MENEGIENIVQHIAMAYDDVVILKATRERLTDCSSNTSYTYMFTGSGDNVQQIQSGHVFTVEENETHITALRLLVRRYVIDEKYHKFVEEIGEGNDKRFITTNLGSY